MPLKQPVRALTHQGNKRLGIKQRTPYLVYVKSDEIKHQSWRGVHGDILQTDITAGF
ncbi:hypothetical protein HJA87_20380 [Rhizobium bangladeshense]|uniref:Uncharacterized protein n=1 Tax=Rhizobium bangladeshense TaxID=1138189 RepID=A0ABS7LLS6_9HYPH|nr:hypothetical protein [Rhizobium bangladeshense]MBX4871893.1 hypothetical protein [Rhizobium bangladeshense]MBX4883207.1 hypothetical protein [Rhizobium bangladeshense]MBX4923306.1 hypothetical protein [Rhizobium bangladeshense]MBY3592213.1 hypothetical protein [Rhizobium bangladeshense]QSY96689.1 hypothetical protein J2J97_23425 [Rhizobium bangladeshense]